MRNPIPALPLVRAAVLAALLPLAACGDRGGGGDRPAGAAAAADTGGTPETGGTAVLAELSDINRPLPLLAESSLDGDLGGDVMFNSLSRGVWRDGGLVYVNATENPTALARAWEFLPPDSSALRYHLASGRRWSDGRPITAADVVFTYKLVKDASVASPQQDHANHIDSVVAENDSTVTFYFDRRYPEMLFHSGLGIAPAHVFEGVAPGQIRTHRAFTDPARHLVVSGPFKIGEWAKGTQVTLVPNPHFPVKPRLERIVIRIIPEATTRLTELMTGNIDFMRPIPFDQVPHVRQQAPNVRFEVEEKRFYDYIGYNPRTFAPFGDPEIRRALGMAIDVKGLIGALQMEGHAVPAGAPYSPIFRDLYDPRTMPPLTYDTAGAIRILEAKGWRDTDGDGVRDRNGQPFRFTFETNSGNARRADVTQIVQQQWKRIGVDARIQMSETNTFFDRLTKKQFQASAGGWSVGLSPDLTTLWGPESPFNFVSYNDPQTTALFEQALRQPTAELAQPIWRQAAGRIAQAQPYTFLYFMDQLDGVNNRLRGMKIDTYGAYQNTWEWWIPRRLQRAVQSAPRPAPADTGAAARTDTGAAAGTDSAKGR
ncbi:MAG TPA: ABC transporter substrate-binding protein [Longimicrobium sp.]|nr:ABC transporter substrate-binding protein [Longimicrobium sp.]